MTLYEVICEMGKAHCRIAMKNSGYSDLMRFNLTKQTVKNGNFYLIKDGKIVIDKVKLADGQVFGGLKDMELIEPQENFKERLEELYAEYYNSRPNRRCNYSKSNFVAKHETELSFDEMVNSKDRLEAMYALEAYVLLSVMSGVDVAKELEIEDKHYYWKSKELPSLVMFRDWMQKEKGENDMAFGNYGKSSKKEEVNYEVIRHFGKLTDEEGKYNKELNLVSWNGNEPKFDLRPWKIDEETGERKMTKGITLTSEEVEALYNILKEVSEEEEEND